MNQETFPEIQVATEALESRISITEAEIAQMKEDIKAKRAHREVLAQGTGFG